LRKKAEKTIAGSWNPATIRPPVHAIPAIIKAVPVELDAAGRPGLILFFYMDSGPINGDAAGRRSAGEHPVWVWQKSRVGRWKSQRNSGAISAGEKSLIFRLHHPSGSIL